MMRATSAPARVFHAPQPNIDPGLGLGTGILTAEGEFPVEFLVPGDRVVTRDGGLACLRDLVAFDLPCRDVVLVDPAGFGARGGLAFHVAASTALMVGQGRDSRPGAARPILAPAGDLADGRAVRRLDGSGRVRLLQLVFDAPQLAMICAGRLFAASAARIPTTQA